MARTLPSGRVARASLLAVAALVALVVVLLLVPSLIPVNSLKPMLVRTIQEKTGYDAEIGDLHLKLLPTVHIEVDGLRLKMPAGLPGGELLSIGETDLDVAIAPLFRKHVRVTGLTLKDVRASAIPTVPTAQSKAGAAAHGGAAAARGAAAAADASRADAASADAASAEPPFSFAPGAPVVARPVSVVINSFGPGLKITPVATIAGLSATLDNLSAIGQPGWEKQLRVSVGLKDASVTAAALTAPLQFSSGEIVVDAGAAKGAFEARLADLSLKGQMQVPDIADPHVRLDLDIPTLDVAALGALAAGGGAASSDQSGGSESILTGTVKIGTVKASGLEAKQFTGQMAIGGRTRLDPFSFTLYGGSVKGSASIDPSASQGLHLTAQANGVNVAQALAANGNGSKASVTGTLEFSGDLRASTSNPETSLAGSGRFAIRDGTFPGVNMQAALAKMNKLLQLDVPEGDTHFTSLTGDYRIAGGRISSREIALDGQGLDVTLQGSVGLDGTLDYAGTAVYKPGEGAPAQPAQPAQASSAFSMLKRAAAGAMKGAVSDTLRRNVGTVRVPFHVGGTSVKPSITPSGVPTVR